MNIKAEIEIITGFLGSGKTYFINALLENTLVPKEKVLVIQCESGEQKIKTNYSIRCKVISKEIDASSELTPAYLKQMINFYNPHRVVIEHNGMKMLSEVLSIFNNKELEKLCLEPAIYNILDASTFDIFYSNMKELVEPCLLYSNLIIVNNCSFIEDKRAKQLKKQIENLNGNAFVIMLDSMEELDSALKRADILDDGISRNLRIGAKNIMLAHFSRGSS